MALLVKTYPPSVHCGPNAFATAKRWERTNTSNPKRRQSSPITGHSPIPKTLLASRRGVLLLRNPLHRLRSAYRFRHSVGMNSSLKERLKSVPNVKEFAEFQGISGCQTKMLSGRCMHAQRHMSHVRMAWHGMVWYGMVWYGMVWYGMVDVCDGYLAAEASGSSFG